jgi:hypothetical protein
MQCLSVHQRRTTVMRNLTLALSMILGACWCSSAQAQLRGVAGTEDVTVKLTRQVAALEMRIKQLELGQAAINQKLNKADVADDGSGEDSKKSKGAPKDAGTTQDAGGPDKGQSSGSAAGASGAGTAKDGGDLKDVPGKPSTGSGNSNSGGNSYRSLNRVTAPFVVVDKTGKVIFRVQDPGAGGGEGGGDRGIYVYDETGKTAAQLVSSRGGGKLKVQKPATDTYVATAANDDGVGTVVKHEGQQRAFLGTAGNGGGVVAVFGGDGTHPAAGMQLGQGGGGLVAVFKNDTAISFLTESTNHPGGGNVTTTDPAGKGVFSAGYDGDLGSACVGRKGSLHCLGIGLPLGGGN